MSKSLARVAAALLAAGVKAPPVEAKAEIRTAEAAAAEAGVCVDQIVKSILFQGTVGGKSGRLFLFLTAGGNRVDPDKAAALAGEPLARAEVDVVRSVTGFAIGGVAPLGHLSPSPTYLDPRLLDFAEVWAAAGTPRHMFQIAPQDLLRITQATCADFTG